MLHVYFGFQERNYGVAFQEFKKAYETQKKYPNRNNNKYMAGITAHNMGVVSVLAGHEDMAMSIFQDAISLKRAAFGEEHPEVAVSSCSVSCELHSIPCAFCSILPWKSACFLLDGIHTELFSSFSPLLDRYHSMNLEFNSLLEKISTWP